jgi:diguanylate cyclase (GGDEF)-like protein
VALAGSPPPWNNPALLDTAEAASRIVTLALEHNRLYDDLRFQIRHDALTGLANRMLFEERLGRALREAEQRRRKLAVLFVDLDHFKQVNDELNHRAGDLYLCEMANRMKNAVRSLDLVARIGGDEFIVMLPHVRDAEEAVGVAERLLAAIQKPLRLEGRELSPTASAGLALYPDDAPTADQLQRFAGLAMHSARQAGCGQVHTFSQRNETLDRARLEEVLRLALRDGRFVVHYQAKASPTGRFMGFEALLRLNHPERGLVQPLEFIPTAERSGLIVPIGAWVLEEVCRQIAAWRDRGFGEMAVAVNVSTLQLDRPDFVAAVMTCLRRSGVAPWHLELELTESILITGSECALRQMRELRALGVRLSIDDFGTGYSSLGYLHRLEIDTVKLDRSFVQPIEKDNMARWLVQAMIGIAQGLGLGVIAEGVETEGQRDALVAAGCPVMQGFLFAKPASAQDLEPLLALLADDLPLRADIVPSGPAEAGAEALMVALGGER